MPKATRPSWLSASFRLLALCGLVFALVLSPGAQLQAKSEEPVSLNFKDADIDTVIGAFGVLLNRTFIIDPRVRGKITVQTPEPLSRGDAYRLLLSALRLQGFTIVSSGRLAKVVPEADAKLQSGPVSVGRNSIEGGDQIITQIFRLNFESVTNLVPILRPLIAPNNTISAYPSNNSLVITDYATNLQRIARIIATLDSPTTRQVEILQVRYGIASDLARMLTRLLDDTLRSGQGAQVDAGQRVLIIADPNSNTIMVRAASSIKVNLAKQLLARLDRPSTNPGNINVVYLRNAVATELAQVLQAVLSGSTSSSAGSVVKRTNRATSALSSTAGGAAGKISQSSPSQRSPVTVSAGGAVIAADPTTNSLIITAPNAVYRNLRSVIDKLDVRRAQVYIESLIVEVNEETAAEFGIQWQFLDVKNGATRALGGTNFTNLDGGGSILSAAANIAGAGSGINLGIVRGTTTLPNSTGGDAIQILNLPLLARALQSDTDTNVLATPNLLVMDNEEAKIVIGQNVPFVTGQFTAQGTQGASVNPFQTIERKDVGITLKVKPQVSESGTVKLDIFQEVSSVRAANGAADIITDRRAVDTHVLVDDGQIIVLGGLLQERVEGGEQKIPLLGDIPFLGRLFRYDSRRRSKTNLLIFLRPVILRDADASYDVTSSRYDFMRELRGKAELLKHWALPDMRPSDLVPMPLPPGTEKTQHNDQSNAPAGTTAPAESTKRLPSTRGYQQSPTSLAPGVNNSADVRRSRLGALPNGANSQGLSNEVRVEFKPRMRSGAPSGSPGPTIPDDLYIN